MTGSAEQDAVAAPIATNPRGARAPIAPAARSVERDAGAIALVAVSEAQADVRVGSAIFRERLPKTGSAV